MDRFTRIYSIVIGILVIIGIAFWAKSSWKPEVWELNQVLENDSEITSYPYQFRVVAFRNGVATISTPRSYDFPAVQFLPVIDPKLARKAQDDPEMIAAQQDLINHQKRAFGLILAQPEVTSVDWRLDIQWLNDHGIHVSSNR